MPKAVSKRDITITNRNLSFLSVNISDYSDSAAYTTNVCAINIDCPKLIFLRLNSEKENVEYNLVPLNENSCPINMLIVENCRLRMNFDTDV